MQQFIIDGNNLIGKIPALHKLQKKDKQQSRIKLAFLIDNYFHNKKAKVTLHFDGFAKDAVRISHAKIVYSDKITADEKIKEQIELSKNPKKITVVTSDFNLKEFARVCSCKVISSEEFSKQLYSKKTDNEQKIIDELKNNMDEFKKLFGVDD